MDPRGELVALQCTAAAYSERVSDPSYSLTWPRELFVWEADRVLALPVDVTNGIATFLREAFADADVEAEFQRQTSADALSDVWDTKTADSITTRALPECAARVRRGAWSVGLRPGTVLGRVVLRRSGQLHHRLRISGAVDLTLVVLAH